MSSAAFDELMRQAHLLENGGEKVALLEAAVREADQCGDVPDAFEARMELIEAAEFSGHAEKAIVAFSWCLAKVDEDGSPFDEFDILWQYKWILGNITQFPQVARERIVGMQDDLARRLERLGCSPRPAHYMRFRNFLRMGMQDEAGKSVTLWLASPRDALADCEACELDNYVEFLVREGDCGGALQKAAPIVNNQLSCAEVPHMTYGTLLEAAMTLESDRDAERFHRSGYRLVRDNPVFIGTAAQHLLYSTWAGRLADGLKMLERHLPWAVHSAELGKVFDFYRAGSAFLQAWQHTPPGPFELSLPAGLAAGPLRHAAADPRELETWFLARAGDLARRFDQRNGNDYCRRRLDQLRNFGQKN